MVLRVAEGAIGIERARTGRTRRWATARPLLELERGSIDIAITSSRIRNQKLCVRDLFSDELVAVVAKDHP